MSQIKSKERVKELAEVYTPPKLVNEMLDRLPKDAWEESIKFIDPACGNGNMLIEVVKRKIAEGHCPIQALSTTYGIDIMEDNVIECRARLLQLSDKSPEAKYWVMNNIKQGDALEVDWPKTTVTITNPPYLSKQMVYLKFLKKAQDNSEYVIGLHPAIPFLDQRDNNKWTKLLSTFTKKLDYIRVVHSKNSFPDVDIQALLCITFWKTHSNGLVYENDLTDVKCVISNDKPDLYSSHLGYDNLFKRFWNLKESDSITSFQIPKKHGHLNGYVVELSLVRGNIHKDGNKKFFKPDIFSFNPEDMEPKLAGTTRFSNKNKFLFQTKEEAENFCHYLNTNFARGTLGIVKRDYNPKYSKTPKVPFNKKWTDDELYKMFDLTQDEIDFIDWLLSI